MEETLTKLASINAKRNELYLQMDFIVDRLNKLMDEEEKIIKTILTTNKK